MHDEGGGDDARRLRAEDARTQRDGDAASFAGETNLILGEAYGKGPEFFEYLLSLEAYRVTFADEGTTMVLSPKSDFFRYFSDVGGLPSRRNSGAESPPSQ